MKTSQDPRHLRRKKIVSELFAWEFNKKSKIENKGTREVISHLDQLDNEITEAAPTWPINQVNRIDLAILRLAIFELIMEKKKSFKVVVDEAVELAKEFGSESSPAFINGVLGKVINKYGLDK